LARSPVTPGKDFSSVCSSSCRSCGLPCSALGWRACRLPGMGLQAKGRQDDATLHAGTEGVLDDSPHMHVRQM
jgi:hypothetical protein